MPEFGWVDMDARENMPPLRLGLDSEKKQLEKPDDGAGLATYCIGSNLYFWIQRAV